MKQTQYDIIELVKFIYGLQNYVIPQNIATKAFIFYTTDEEKLILKKNNIYCLTNECTQDDIIDVFHNKIMSDSLIGLHTSDIKLLPILQEMNIPSLIVSKNPTIEIFDTLGLSLGSNYYNMSDKDFETLKRMFIEQLIKIGIIALGPLVGIAKINDNSDFSEEGIHKLLTTNYNIENVFNDDFEKISNFMMSHARSNN